MLEAFRGVRFVLLGFNDPAKALLVRSKLVSGGGQDVGQYCQSCTHLIVDKIVCDDPACVKARRDGKVVVTRLWVEHSYDLGMPIDHASVIYRPLKDLNGIPGAKNFIMCLTGYQRQDRDDVMMMVNLMGAQFSKPLIANKVTHLICYKFEGEKYELAKKMKKIKLINHMWLEDCLNAWEILPESNYTKSGYELEMEAEAKDSEEEPDGGNTRQSVGRTGTSSPFNVQVGMGKTPELPLPSLGMSNAPLCPIAKNASTDKRVVLAAGQESTTCQSIFGAEKPELFGKFPVSGKMVLNQASTSGCSTLVAEVENENASTPQSAKRSAEVEKGNGSTPKSAKRSAEVEKRNASTPKSAKRLAEVENRIAYTPESAKGSAEVTNGIAYTAKSINRSPLCDTGIISDPSHMRKTPRRLSPQGGNSSYSTSIKMSTSELHVANDSKSLAKVGQESDGTGSFHAKTPLKHAGSPQEEVLTCISPLKRKVDTSCKSIKVQKTGHSPSRRSKVRQLETTPPIHGQLETSRQHSPISGGSREDKSATPTSKQDSPHKIHTIKSLGSGKCLLTLNHVTLNTVPDKDEGKPQQTSCWELKEPNSCRKLDTEVFSGENSMQETSVKSEFQKRQMDVKAYSPPAENDGKLSNLLKRKKSLDAKPKYTRKSSNQKGSLQVNGISKNNFAESSNKVTQATDTTNKSYDATASETISLLENVVVAADIKEADVLISGFQLSSETMDEETEAPDGKLEPGLDKMSNLDNMRHPQNMLVEEVQNAENSANTKSDHAMAGHEGRDLPKVKKAVSAKKRDTSKAIKGNTIKKKASKRGDMTPRQNILMEEIQEAENNVKENSDRAMAFGESRDSPNIEKAASMKKMDTLKAIKGNTTKRNTSKGDNISHQQNFWMEQTQEAENSVREKSDNVMAFHEVSDSLKVEKAICANKTDAGKAVKGNTNKRNTSKEDNVTHEEDILAEVQTAEKNVKENRNLAMATTGGRESPKFEKAVSVKKKYPAKATKRNTSKGMKSGSNSKMDPVPSVTKSAQPEEGLDGVVIQNRKDIQKMTAEDKNVESVGDKVRRPNEHVSKLENLLGFDGDEMPSSAENEGNKQQNEDTGKTALKTNKKSKKAKLKTVKTTSDCKQLQMVQKRLKEEAKWFILCGHRLQRKEFQKVIRSLKGRLCRDSHQWSYQATHFIVPDPIRRTEKFFAAAASGRWILKTDYVSASNQAGKLLAEEPYEWYKSGLSEDGAVNLEAPRKWRRLRERTGHGAFHEMRIVVYGDCIAPPLDTLKRVVKAGNGVILATSPPYTRFLNLGVHFAIVSPGMTPVDMWVQEFLKHEIPCVVADYLVEYVCKPGFSLEKHVLYNTYSWAEKSVADLLSKSEEIVDDLTGDDPDNSDITCQVCGSADRGEVMLICGNEGGTLGCGIGTHIDCCDPPFEEVPEEDWFCAKCSINMKSSKSAKVNK